MCVTKKKNIQNRFFFFFTKLITIMVKCLNIGRSLILTQVQSLSLPRSTHLSQKVLSTPRLRTAGCHAGNSTVLHVLSCIR